MNLKEIKELIKIIDSSSLSELHIEQDDLKLTIKKEVVVQQINAAGFPMSQYLANEGNNPFQSNNTVSSNRNGANIAFPSPVSMSMSASTSASTSASASEQALLESESATNKIATEIDDRNIHIVKSPIVGMFYGAPTPEAPKFVKVGDRVKTGQVLCIIEAMKMMNEITSDADGEVVEILGQDQEPVEFGQSLFKIRKA